ncbi:MAG: NAD(P)H-binding protein [Nocardiopsaceae bacterium]|nr:NAD(P)H-binding protein [Nocardiopsaceae bacterium]
MSVVLVTGGTGTLGSKLVPILAERGHEVRVLSRQRGRGTHLGDLRTGAGVAEAADGAELVVHAASQATGLLRGKTDAEQTRRLIAASKGCRHLLYTSIVGVDEIPLGYYAKKLACERLIENTQIPYTILRATQFHELMAGGFAMIGKSPAVALPLDFVFQSVAAAEVAARVAELIEGQPLGRALDFGGPQVLTIRQMLASWRDIHGRPRLIAGLRWPGRLYGAFAAGRNTCPDRAYGVQTWAEFIGS